MAIISAERRKQILELIEKRNSITVIELCQILNVSDMTIRRDLRILSNRGLLERVYGGALSRRGRSYEPPYLSRTMNQAIQKKIIGRCAAALVKEGDIIALDVGTTTLEVAKALVRTPNLTIITASLPIANILSEVPNIRLIITGGIARNQELSLIGNIAEQTYQQFHMDRAFVGVGGIHLETGLTEYNLEDTLVKKAMIANSEQVIVVADSSKLGETCFTSIGPLSVVDTLVTDASAPPEVVDRLRAIDIEVIIAQ
jgi:DeoR/GlpR family transcriptional regulator of sugar metabolism